MLITCFACLSSFSPPLACYLGIVVVWIPLGLIAFDPLFLSIVLTRISPEKQIVPPLYIAIVSLGWFAGFMAIRYPSEIYPVLLFYGFYAFIIGSVLNRVAVSLLGITVRTSDFLFYSFVVRAHKELVRDVLEREPIRNNLGLSTGMVDEDRPLIYFEGGGDVGYQMKIQVSQTPPSNHSTVSAIFCEKTDWYVKPTSEELREWAESEVVYLKSLFDRPEHHYPIDHDGWDRTLETDDLISTTMADMEGFIPRFREISRTGWVKVGAFVAALNVIAYTAFRLQDYPTSTGLFVALLLYLAFELRSGAER